MADRVRIGRVDVDVLRASEALDAIEALVRARRGGAVFTPNVDHLVKLERDPALRAAYDAAELRLADGMPLVWASRLLGSPLPERVAGADLVGPLAARAAARGWRLYLLGGPPGVAARAARVLAAAGVTIAGHDAPWIDEPPCRCDGAARATSAAAAERVRAARADLVYVGLGAPKQELWIHRHRDAIRPAVAIGVGASLSYVAGALPRAPRWMARAGLEWAYRLTRESGRLWRRYLVDDLAFARILLRSWRAAAAELAPPSPTPPTELVELWFELCHRPWSSVVLVPADAGASAGPLARALADVGSRLRDAPVTAIVQDQLEYATATALAECVAAAARSPARVVVAVPPLVLEPLGTAAVQAADAVILCIEPGRTRLEAARRTIALAGRERVVGCLLLT